MNYLEQNTAMGRHVFPDLVRAFALMGIVLVNVAYFAYPGPETYGYGSSMSELDHAAIIGVDSLFLLKSYSLFSIMFGAGLAYQMMSAQRREVAFAPRYFRRLVGLVVLGFLHIALAFAGDILVLYAIIGSLLFLFRNLSVKALKRWAFGILILQILLVALTTSMIGLMEAFEPDAATQMIDGVNEAMAQSAEIYRSGSFLDVAVQRLLEYREVLMFAGFVQGPGALAFFLFGLAGVKSGVLQDPTAKLWQSGRRIFLPIGLIISVIGAVTLSRSSGTMSSGGMVGSTLIIIGAPFSTLGYLGWIAKWAARPMTSIKLFFARAGTASLSAYLLQSLILSLIFCGYGLGLFMEVGAAGCIAIAFVTGLVTLSFTSLWRKRFKRGPMEALLRRWTYLDTGR